VSFRIDWKTAEVRRTDRARLALSVQLVDGLLGTLVDPNPIWLERFAHAAKAHKARWRAENRNWGIPALDDAGRLTVDPLEGSDVEAALLPAELDALVERANELEGGEWAQLEAQARHLTKEYRSSR
jgi:hypothetical protein